MAHIIGLRGVCRPHSNGVSTLPNLASLQFGILQRLSQLRITTTGTASCQELVFRQKSRGKNHLGTEERPRDATPRRHKSPAAMLFLIATGALSTLAYYFFRGESDEEPEQTKTRGTANRNRDLDRQKAGKGKQPEIHRRKVKSAAAETLRRAQDRAETLLERGKEEKLACESYFLSESINEMFVRSEFFERSQRFDSKSGSTPDVQDWGHFDQLLHKEREHCMADSWKHTGTGE